MKDTGANQEKKKAAALKAAERILSGQRVGLGTGSTAAFFIEELGRRVREEGLQIECVATSYSSQERALRLGLPVLPLEKFSKLDISVDGADEIDPHLNLIKGGGGAMAMEKLVQDMSDHFIVVADESKLTDRLGSTFSVPVEIIRPATSFVERRLRELGSSEVNLRLARQKDGPVVTENGNFILDARFGISDPMLLEDKINQIPGVLENGIFSISRNPSRLALIANETGVKEFHPVY